MGPCMGFIEDMNGDWKRSEFPARTTFSLTAKCPFNSSGELKLIHGLIVTGLIGISSSCIKRNILCFDN